MFIVRKDLENTLSNDSEGFALQDSLLSKVGVQQFIQMDEKGYFNRGLMHIKASLEKDNLKSLLLDVNENDTILQLKKKIGERIENAYDIYRGLRNLQASKIIKRSTNQLLLDDEVVKQVLRDGDEVLFELESYDLWLNVVFHLLHKNEPYIYGMADIRIDKNEKIEGLKKKLQKVAYNMWSKALRCDNKLYVVDSFDLKTLEEALTPQYRLLSLNVDRINNSQRPSNNNVGNSNIEQSRVSPPSKDQSGIGPTIKEQNKNFSPKRKMFDMKHLQTFNDCVVGDIFGYKNQVFMKVVFRAIIISNFHRKFRPIILTNQSLMSDESDGSDDNLLTLPNNKNGHHTVKVQSQRSSEKFMTNLHKPMINLMPANSNPNVYRRTGKHSHQGNNDGDIQLKDIRAGGINSGTLTVGGPGAIGAHFTTKSENNAGGDVFNNENIYSLFSKMIYQVVFVNNPKCTDQFDILIHQLFQKQQQKIRQERLEKIKEGLRVDTKDANRSYTLHQKRNSKNPFDMVSTPGLPPLLSLKKGSMYKKQPKQQLFNLFKVRDFNPNRSRSQIKMEDHKFDYSYESTPNNRKKNKPKKSKFSNKKIKKFAINQSEEDEYDDNYIVADVSDDEFIHFGSDMKLPYPGEQPPPTSKNLSRKISTHTNHNYQQNVYGIKVGGGYIVTEEDQDIVEDDDSEEEEDEDEDYGFEKSPHYNSNPHDHFDLLIHKASSPEKFKQNTGTKTKPKTDQSIELIRENIIDQNLAELIKPFVLSMNEIQMIKEPKLRNLNMQSKLKNFVKQNDGEHDENGSFDPEAFFNSILNSYNPMNNQQQDKKDLIVSKDSFKNRFCFCILLMVIASIIVFASLFIIDPSGFRDFLERIMNEFFEYLAGLFGDEFQEMEKVVDNEVFHDPHI